MATLFEQKRITRMEETTNKNLHVIAIFKTENGKRKLIDLHFPTETLRAIIDKAFIKSSR